MQFAFSTYWIGSTENRQHKALLQQHSSETTAPNGQSLSILISTDSENGTGDGDHWCKVQAPSPKIFFPNEDLSFFRHKTLEKRKEK